MCTPATHGRLLCHRELGQGQRKMECRILVLWALRLPWQLPESIYRRKTADQEGWSGSRAGSQELGLPKWAVSRVLLSTLEAPPGRSPACPRRWGVEGPLAHGPAGSLRPSQHQETGTGCCAAVQRGAGWPLGETDRSAFTFLSLSVSAYRAGILSALGSWSPEDGFLLPCT